MNKKILIVDDNQDNRDLLRKILRNPDYTFFEATDGQQAVDLAVANIPDLILMDIQLPIMSGYQAAEKIRQIPELAKAKILGLTSYAMVGDREKVLASGCDDYIAKPIDVAVLRQLIEKYLEGNHA